MGYGETGYAYIINTDGDVIAHPDRSMVLDQFNAIEEARNDSNLESTAEMVENMLDNQFGVDNYHFDGEDLYCGFAQVEGHDWILNVTADEDEVLAALPQLLRNAVITTGIFLLLSVVGMFFMATTISNPIKQLTTIIDRLANYNFTFVEDSKASKYLKKKR